MAPSLRDLIDYLLAEIALCGGQGASPADILAFTDVFYTKTPQNASGRRHTVDRRFQAKVWSWLTRNPEVSVGQQREGNHLSLDEAEHEDSQAQSPDIRVFVSQKRTWLALTGHEPDETKLLPMEFALLSIIASHKSNGIVQTELVRLSGQDKRSVPKRTDMLQRKGYIEKRAVQIKSARTSLCILRRFLNTETAADANARTSGEESRLQDSMIDFNEFTKQLFSILEEHQIIYRADLKKLLGFEDRWRWKILSRALRKFERIGVLKRVRALSQYADAVAKYHPCVKLVRLPTSRDMEMFHEFSKNIFAHGEEDDADLDEDMAPPREEGDRTGNLGDVEVKREDDVEEAGRPIPAWDPDRVIHNQIFDIIDQSGTAGCTNQDAIKACFGGFYRRPLENILARLVECWQLSQPPHLRHLAIVRDTTLIGTIIHYIHYSANNFRKMVEAGEADWEAVEFVPKANQSKISVPPVDATPELDEHGLPLKVPVHKLLKNGNASLLECMAVVRPADYVCSSSDPQAVKLDDGSYTIHYGHKKLPNNMRQRLRESQRALRKAANEPGEADEDASDVEMADVSQMPYDLIKPKREDDERFRGMSEKEKLEALGLDETWTEYKILVMERSGPGLYVTPRGKRRPAGKRQGRPKISRIAAFKSPKLLSLPWFVPERGSHEMISVEETPRVEENEPTPAAASVSRDLASSVGPEETETRTRRSKRSMRQRHSETEQEAASGKPAKHPRVEAIEGEAVTPEPQSPARFDGLDNRMSSSKSNTPHPKRKRMQSLDGAQEAGQDATTSLDPALFEHNTVEAPSKRPRLANGDLSEPQTPAHRSIQAPEASSAKLSDQRSASKEAQVADGRRHTHKKEKGGSVAFLRRKIILDVVEKAGGAYPMGSELWYPFATAWMKTKHKETPDMRTIRSSAKHMIDSGKLRQLTFSGRDSKGVMVTKSIVYKSELQADDPVIKDMQKKMLATQGRFYIPPEVEVYADLTKSGRKPQPIKTEHHLPVENQLRVQLQEKPASVLAQERRKGLSIQRKLLQRLESVHGEGHGRGRTKSGVVRLASIRRPAGQSVGQALTSIAAPEGAPAGRRSGAQRMMPFSWRSISSIAPYAMFMNPQQTMHAATGTFSTDAGLAALQAARVARQRTSRVYPKRKVYYGLPKSLDDLLNETHREEDAVNSADRFFLDTDAIFRWELENHDILLSSKTPDVQYINQTIQGPFETAPVDSNAHFDETYTPSATYIPPATSLSLTSRAPRRTTRNIEFEYESVPEDAYMPSRRLAKLSASLAADEAEATTSSVQEITPRFSLRRNRTARSLSTELTQRIMTAIVAVRCLAGGSEGKMVDWALLSKAFPNHEPQFIQERGRNILNRNRLQMVKMQVDFQERFLEAYANEQVPPINYDDLEGYDWEGLVDWAIAHLDAPKSEKLPDLPATREQFDSVFEIREENAVSVDEVYQNPSSVSTNRTRSLLAGTPFAVPLPKASPGSETRKAELSQLEVAKSWIRANVVADESTYRPADAHAILVHLGERVLSDALQSLMTERVVSMGNRGRVTPGRNYDITEHFISNLGRKRMIESVELRRAGRFKTNTLDPELQLNGVFDVNYNAEDGDILALINMFAQQQVLLRPRDPPRDKLGLTDGGYITRQLDKTKLRFAVEVRPVEGTYVYGNPMEESVLKTRPPCPPLIDLSPGLSVPEKIPLWFDIHGQFVKVLWERAVAAVVGCVAVRPGIQAEMIAGMVQPCMGAWEVQLLLEWMGDVGVVERWGGGWRTREWWWMVLV